MVQYDIVLRGLLTTHISNTSEQQQLWVINSSVFWRLFDSLRVWFWISVSLNVWQLVVVCKNLDIRVWLYMAPWECLYRFLSEFLRVCKYSPLFSSIKGWLANCIIWDVKLTFSTKSHGDKLSWNGNSLLGEFYMI